MSWKSVGGASGAVGRATGPRFNFDKSHEEQNRKFKSGLDRAPLATNLTVILISDTVKS